uniref:dTCF n=1 Tax=Anopheles coluzzii TaxID=1518534 RepID=A0A8W7P6P1_ANOCL
MAPIDLRPATDWQIHRHRKIRRTPADSAAGEQSDVSTGDELGSTDEVKVFKDEGDRDDEKLSENLLEEKSSLIDLTESEEKTVKNGTTRHESSNTLYGGSGGPGGAAGPGSKLPHGAPHPGFNMGYIVPPYSYPNGAAGGLPVSMANKMSLPPFFCHNGDHLSSPPPAHCGILPYQLDPKTMSLTRPPLYSFPTSQYPYPMISPDMLPVASSWHSPSLYSPAAGFRTPYPSSLQIYTSLSSDFYRYSPTLLPPSIHPSHPVLNSGHPAIITPGPKQDISGSGGSSHREPPRSGNCYALYAASEPSQPEQHKLAGEGRKQGHNHHQNHHNNNNGSGGGGGGHKHQSLAEREAALEKKRSHVKKPLNAFMLYMKEMRAKVVAECTLKESAAINQILGRKWHSLSREEQSVYYDKARQERQLHMELYPGWTARDNYGYGAKKKKRKKDRSPADPGGNSMKKCRARYGLDQQNQWCKPCRRKKKCIRYKEAGGGDRGGDGSSDREGGRDRGDGSDDAIGSCGSMEDDSSKSPGEEDEDRESINQSLSSPRCLSVLSSLQSPSTSIASPLNLLASPATPTNFYHHHDHLGLASMIASAQQQHQQQQLQQQLQQHQQQQQQHYLHQHHHHHHHHHQQAAAAAAVAAAALQNVSDKLNNISNDSGIGGSQLNNSYSNNFSPYNNHHTMRTNSSSSSASNGNGGGGGGGGASGNLNSSSSSTTNGTGGGGGLGKRPERSADDGPQWQSFSHKANG